MMQRLHIPTGLAWFFLSLFVFTFFFLDGLKAADLVYPSGPGSLSITTFQGATAHAYSSIAVESSNSIGFGQLQIYSNNGDGTFGTGTGPNQTFTQDTTTNNYVVASDVFNFGLEQILVLGSQNQSVTIYKNNGTGAFETDSGIIPVYRTNTLCGVAKGTFFPYVLSPNHIATVSRDNILTVLSGSYEFVYYFMPSIHKNLSQTPTSVAGGKIISSTLDDILVSYVNNQFEVFTYYSAGGSTGYTGAGIYSAGGTGPTSIVVADFNGDGLSDVAIANATSCNVAVFINTGNTGYGQTFGTPVLYPVGKSPVSISAANIFTTHGSTGYFDLVVANQADSTYTVLKNEGTLSGSFVQGMTGILVSGPSSVSTGTLSDTGGVFNCYSNSLGQQINVQTFP